MEVKHWFRVAMMLQPDDENSGAMPTVRGVQRVYVDDNGVMIDLAGVFVNLGVAKLTPKTKAFILRNSKVVATEPMMIEPDKVAGVLMEALASGLLPNTDLKGVQEYILDLTNHVVHSAVSAYHAANPSRFSEEADDGAEAGDET